MDAFLAEKRPAFPLPEKFEKFTSRGLKKKTRKNWETPRHPFFLRCDAPAAGCRALQWRWTVICCFSKERFFRPFGRNCRLRKRRRNIQSFDDLLIRLRRSLEKAGGDRTVPGGQETVPGRPH